MFENERGTFPLTYGVDVKTGMTQEE